MRNKSDNFKSGLDKIMPDGAGSPDKSVVVESPIRQFDFAEEFIKKRNKFIMILFITCVPVAFLLLWMTSTASPKILISSFIMTVIVVAIILAIEMPFLYKAMRQIKFVIYKDKVVKNFGKGKEASATWSQIDKIKLVRNTKGYYTQIIVYSQNRQLMRLFGFSQMEEIARLIKENISNNTSVITTQQKIDPENPFWLILGGIAGIAIITIIHLGGAKIEDIFNLLFMIGLAIVAFIFKPISKSNPNLKKIEMVAGCLAIIAIIFMLLGMLWPLLFGSKS